MMKIINSFQAINSFFKSIVAWLSFECFRNWSLNIDLPIQDTAYTLISLYLNGKNYIYIRDIIRNTEKLSIICIMTS